MIAPRTTRLVRAAGLRAFRRCLVRLATAGTVSDIRRRAILVPSRTAAEQLRRSIEDQALAGDSRASVLPWLLTRDEWLAQLCAGLAGAPPAVSVHEREVLLGAAAREAAATVAPPFTLRPGLLAQMLDFYDALRRNLKSIDDFERLAGEELEKAADSDRGAARMLEQTRFMVATYRGYQRRLASAGRCDEHAFRALLLAEPASPFSHVVLAVSDRAGDLRGLWPADFDLLSRAHGIERIDVVATQSLLSAGFLTRVSEALPGLDVDIELDPPGTTGPVIAAPAGDDARLHGVSRDREEEIRAVARRIKSGCRGPQASRLWRTGIVFRRPLPYVYLAGQMLPAAGIPYQAFDALPLAAEPYAATLDLIVECVETNFSRSALVALLRSPLLGFEVEGCRVSTLAVSLLDRALAEARYLGDPAELPRLAATWSADVSEDDVRGQARRLALQAAACRAGERVADQLAPLSRDGRPSVHLDTMLMFLASHERMPGPAEGATDRFIRARAAIRASLTGLREAHLAHDDSPQPFRDTAAAIRRWVEQQTFAPRRGSSGVQLLDADAARFGDFETMYLVGLTQREWPGSERRNIFYPSSMLSHLGWPAEADARAADRAAFEDLVASASIEVVASTFTLEDDGIVEPSPFLEDLARSGLTVRRDPPPARARIFTEEALTSEPVRPDVIGDPAAAWLAARLERTSAADDRYHGRTANPHIPAYKVSALDQYLACPFVFFATQVLRLEEDPDDEEALGPKAQGRLVHEIFERFYAAWQQGGHGAITAGNLDEARAACLAIVDQQLAGLPESDAALQRARLAGSPVAPGFIDVVLQMEAERPAEVVERLLEYSLDGETLLREGAEPGAGRRAVRLKAKADRIDLFANGTFRLVDYKLSRAPVLSQVVQLPAYAAAARTKLEGHLGRSWTPSDAAYVALAKAAYAPVAGEPAGGDQALAEGEARTVDVVGRIEAGQFPPAPQSPHRCSYCPFSSVCRKDYVGAE